MPVLSFTDLGGYKCFGVDECRDVGRELNAQYHANQPFPHIALDEFLEPDVLRQVFAEFPDSAEHNCFLRDQERYKFQIRPDQCSGPATRMLFSELNSRAFLSFLSELTGIDGLIPDPYFSGAGLHETKRGGHLSIHSDFPRHAEMRLDRRLNLLIYLNEDWQPEYGGALELWDKKMRQAGQTILPTFGRAVVFNTERDTFHGHPDPLTCPDHRSRRSIATYYYTARAEPAVRFERSTDFRRRPRSTDKHDWNTIWHHLKADWIPPALRRRRSAG